MDGGQHVSEFLGQLTGLVRADLLPVRLSAQHQPGHVRHDVERGADHLQVSALPGHRGDRDGGAAKRAEHLVFPAHVVRGGQHVAERGAAQHQQRRVRAGRGPAVHQVGQVGPATRDQPDRGRRGHREDAVVAQPAAQPRQVVDAGHQAGSGAAAGLWAGSGASGGHRGRSGDSTVRHVLHSHPRTPAPHTLRAGHVSGKYPSGRSHPGRVASRPRPARYGAGDPPGTTARPAGGLAHWPGRPGHRDRSPASYGLPALDLFTHCGIGSYHGPARPTGATGLDHSEGSL